MDFNSFGEAIFESLVIMVIAIIIGIVQLVFIALKLFKAIDWSWLWVMSPLWITLFVIGVWGLLVLIVTWFNNLKVNHP